MRRFESVQGSSAKFWEASIEGTTFVTSYGRLGSAGQRKEKAFDTVALAQKELDKKVAEKLREGYAEVVVGASAAGAKGAAAASTRLSLPPRVTPRAVTAEHIDAAVASLNKLNAALSQAKHSWVVGVAHRRARIALSRVAGIDPASNDALASLFESLIARVGRGEGKLSVSIAFDLLWYVDPNAFEKALEVWAAKGVALPAVDLARSLVTDLGDAELGFRLASLMLRSSSDLGWTHRWAKLSPMLEAHLATRKGGMRGFLKQLSPSTDARINRSIRSLQGNGVEASR
ncbi:MAG: WGR domain-containing protein [Polyangiaceae bacterium]